MLSPILKKGLFLIFLLCPPAFSSETLWSLTEDGIELDVAGKNIVSHKDHFAMSGRAVDLILEWSVSQEGGFQANRWVRWPMLRRVPNNTHAAFNQRFGEKEGMIPLINGKKLSAGKVEEVTINGIFEVTSNHAEGIRSVRRIFPASSGPAVIDLIELENNSADTVQVTIPAFREKNNREKQYRGTYVVEEFILGEGTFTLFPGDRKAYSITRTARQENEAPYMNNPEMEQAARREFVREMKESLVLTTPSPVLDRMFSFAKIRAAESIFSTRGGLMHGPGGYNLFLAAIWANDQAEYINPFFPFLGDQIGNESAMNSFRWFATYMNPEYKPIPSSIISEGEGFWNGAGDRGDAAMIAHGAARFALASGNKEWGRELLPLIEWCLEYTRRQMMPEGVAASKSDELEGRFPSGKANLCTNTLYYDALVMTARLCRELAPDKAEKYKRESEVLLTNIKKYFEGEVEGYQTYKYYEGNTKLRSWICMPMVVGIYDRAAETTEALLSPKIWFGHGMLTESGSKTYWDRSALYSFKGIFAAGQIEKAFSQFMDYSRERLLGQHVPYAIEAWPEAGQSHLSAESGLYCRIFIEGLFGIEPAGFRAFTIKPMLPKEWEFAELKNMKAFGNNISIYVARQPNGISLKIINHAGETIYEQVRSEGEKHEIQLP